MTKTTTSTVTELNTTKLEADLEQLEAQRSDIQRQLQTAIQTQRELSTSISELTDRMDQIKGELLAHRTPFKRGDIVVDDEGVRYRVHAVHCTPTYVGGAVAQAGSVWGIRLTKTGVEAYAKPREIVSSKPLTKEQP